MAKEARISASVLEGPKPKTSTAARNHAAPKVSPDMWAGTVGGRALEASCLRRIGQGDEDAARELIGRLHPLVLKLVRAYLPRRASE